MAINGAVFVVEGIGPGSAVRMMGVVVIRGANLGVGMRIASGAAMDEISGLGRSAFTWSS